MNNSVESGLKLSIITVCLNASDSIISTIDSVINQTYSNIEYIIIDGKSTDNTLSLINCYRNRIDHLISEKDNGIYDAMNKGSHIASGEYLLFLNAGDYLLGSDVVSKIIPLLDNVDVVFGNVITNKFRKPFENDPKLRSISAYLTFNTLPHQSTFIKRESFLTAGSYNTSYLIRADYDLFLKMFIQYKYIFKYINKNIAFFCDGGVSTTESNNALMQKETISIWKCHFPRWKYYFLVLWKRNILFLNVFLRIFYYAKYILYNNR